MGSHESCMSVYTPLKQQVGVVVEVIFDNGGGGALFEPACSNTYSPPLPGAACSVIYSRVVSGE